MQTIPLESRHIRLPVLLSAALIALSGCASPAQAAGSGPEQPLDLRWSMPAVADTGTLVLSGEGSVRVPADRARIQIAVETDAVSAAEAAARNATQTTAVIAALRPLLGDDDRMETSGYQLTPVYAPRNRDDDGPRIIGYQALNHVTVVIAQVDLAGAVLDAAIGAGANRVAELSFFASDLTAAREEALRMAIAQARQQALIVADALEVPLGGILDVRTGMSEPSFRRGAMQFEMAMADATPIEAGSQVVTASVTVTWSLPGTTLPGGMR